MKLFLSKKMKQIISKKDLNKLEEVQGSKLSKDSTIISKMSNFPLNLNINEKKEGKEEKKEKKERKEKKEKKEKKADKIKTSIPKEITKYEVGEKKTKKKVQQKQ